MRTHEKSRFTRCTGLNRNVYRASWDTLYILINATARLLRVDTGGFRVDFCHGGRTGTASWHRCVPKPRVGRAHCKVHRRRPARNRLDRWPSKAARRRDAYTMRTRQLFVLRGRLAWCECAPPRERFQFNFPENSFAVTADAAAPCPSDTIARDGRKNNIRAVYDK